MTKADSWNQRGYFIIEQLTMIDILIVIFSVYTLEEDTREVH